MTDDRKNSLRYILRMDLQRRVSRWIVKHERFVRIFAALFFAIAGTLTAVFIDISGSERAPDLLGFALIWGASATAYWYRTRPLMALPGAVALVLPYWILDYAGGGDAVLWFMFYAATRHGQHDRQRVWQIVGACFFAIMAVATVGVIVPAEDLPAVALLAIFLLHGTFVLVGEALYQRSQYVAELEQRAAALESDLENKAALAAVEERTRIAREMHDIIAHGMSTIVVQAQAAQSVVDTNPAGARDVLETIEQIGRDSVDEMRRMLGVLRDDSAAALAPQPTIGDLTTLHEHVSQAGVDFALTVSGDERPLPPGLELTGYRIVQEAITNVLRHAGRPVRVDASVTYSDTALSIDVVDNGRGAAANPATHGSGHGITGMRERVAIYGGSFDAGPNPGGGFRVSAELPIHTQAVA